MTEKPLTLPERIEIAFMNSHPFPGVMIDASEVGRVSAGIAGDLFQGPMPVTQCVAVGKVRSDPASYASSYSGLRHSDAYASRMANEALEKARAEDIETHEKSAPAIAHNQTMIDFLKLVMGACGVAPTFRERDPRSRSVYPKNREARAGYIADLSRTFPTSDGFEQATRQYDGLKTRYDEFAARAQRAKSDRDAAAEQERAKRQADMEFAMLLVRYECDATTQPWQLLDRIRGRNKHLDLAIAMQDVRGDWSEGCDAVTDALGRFTIESDQDRQIAADVHGAVNSFHDCRDGRVFRDTGWSYDKLFNLVDASLAEDAQKVRAMLDR